MNKAQVTKRFYGRADNEGDARYFEKDEVIEGELAASAVKDGNAKAMDERAAAKAAQGGGAKSAGKSSSGSETRTDGDGDDAGDDQGKGKGSKKGE